jgi:hypothetical protein
MTLTDAILDDNKAWVEQLVLAGTDIDEIDVYGFTPLIETAIQHTPVALEIAAFLLAQGADVNLPDVTGRTALHWAVDNADISLARLLLEHKANPNAYTHGSQPVLVYPLLRDQLALKKLLYQYGADLNFAQDFINTKLLGHRYQLMGYVDIVDANNRFIELDYEGFFLEFTLSIVCHSLERYRNNFAARHLRPYFEHLYKIIEALKLASELIKYQRYTIDLNQYAEQINSLLSSELLLLPVAYEGHAVTFILYKNWLVRCDRGENSLIEGSVVFYRISRANALTHDFLKNLIYKRQDERFITQGIKDYLGLVSVFQLPLKSQIIGNCSWANVEASVPTILFLLMLQNRQNEDDQTIAICQQAALSFYRQWQEWDKDRALEECIQSFTNASPARQASKASTLAAILFQCCYHLNLKDVERAEKMLPLLVLPEYTYILKAYLETYYKRNNTEAGKNLHHLLDICGVHIS